MALTGMGARGAAGAVMGICAVLAACSGRLIALESHDGAAPPGTEHDAATTSTGAGGAATGSGGSGPTGAGGVTGSGGVTSGGSAGTGGDTGSGGAMTGGAGGTTGGAADASTGAGGVSTGGAAGGGPGGAAGSAGRIVSDAACAGTLYDVNVFPRNLLIVANSSRTMDCPWGVSSPGCNDFDAGSPARPTRWSIMSAAINQAASFLESRGAAFGLFFSPRIVSVGGTNCGPSTDTAVSLPGGAAAIANVLAQRSRAGESLLAWPLDGAISSARFGANVAIVYDGESDFRPCADDTIDRAEFIAATGLAVNPPILTTVIGIGSALTDLHRVAKAGGTPQAHLISTELSVEDATQRLAYALREAATPCEFAIPGEIGAPGIFDPTRFNVRTLLGGVGEWRALYNVPGASRCLENAMSDGWYYDNAEKPTKVILCPTTCQSLAHDDAPSVSFIAGCPTTYRPPPN